jgi:DNA-binding CsgD family transcriptional regulator
MAVAMPPRLLERSAELDELVAGLEAARGGAGRFVVVEGAAGIGKTRLLAAARETVGRTGVRALSARGTELERDFPFALVRQLLEPAVRELDQADRREALAGAAAAAGPVLGVGDAGSGAVDPSFVTLNALYWLTSNLAEPQPLLLAVDDVHWADGPSLRFFRFLVSRLEDLPVLVVFAARPAEPGAQPELLADLIADPASRVMRPRALSRPAVAELVRAELHPEATEEFCDACHQASGGNPFMLHELVGELTAGDSRGTASEAVRIREVAPEAIRRAVLVRLARLPEPASQLARAVAVLGDDVALPDAARLADLERTDAATAADALASAGILEPRRPLQFVHPLVRTAVYADMPGADKAAAHRRAARLLLDDDAEPERIAIHLLATDPDHNPQVADTLAAAARRALDRAAPETAATYLQRALTEPPETDTRVELLRLLIRAHFRAGNRDAFEDLIASGVFDEITADQHHLLDSATEFAHLLHNWGSDEEMVSLLERATTAALAAGDVPEAARFQATLAFWSQLAPAEALARLDRFADRLEPDTPAERLSLALQAQWRMLTGAPRSTVAGLALRAVEDGKIWRDYPDSPMPTVATYALRCIDELDAAKRALDDYTSVVGPRGAWARVSEGWERGQLSFLRGEVLVAETEARTSVEVARTAGYLLAFPPWLALLVEVLVERDDLAGAEAELVRSGATAAMPDAKWWSGDLLFSRARLRLAQGDPRAALEDLVAFGALATRYQLRGDFHPIFCYLALALHAAGEKAEAQRVAAHEVAAARVWGQARKTGLALRTLGLVEGGERGLGLLRESIGVLESSPARLELMRSMAEYGAALRRANRRAEAREPLRTALEWTRGAGALAVARRAHEELEATGERLRPLLAGGVDSLTPSERRIADLAAQGHTNREIAQSLFLTVKTVENHLTSAYRKLDIHTRTELPAALT